MTKEQLIADLFTRTCELVWLPLKVNEIIYWRYMNVLHGRPEKKFTKLILSIDTKLLLNLPKYM